jgi:hypothetical protein
MKHTSKFLAALCGLVLSVAVGAATFPLFGPATGILKGSATSPITSAATSADIVATFTGCTAGEFLRQNGDCTLVTLTSSVTGTLPVANGGTGATSLTGLIVGNGTSPFTAASVADITDEFAGTCDSTTYLVTANARPLPGLVAAPSTAWPCPCLRALLSRAPR